MARDDNVRIDSSVVNFLTLRPPPLLVRHGGSRSPVTHPLRLNRVHYGENAGIIRERYQRFVDQSVNYSGLFVEFPCHRVRFPAKACVVGVRRVLQKGVFTASHSVFCLSLYPCPFLLVPPPVLSDPSLDVHQSRLPNSPLPTPFSLPGPLLSLQTSPKGLLSKYAHRRTALKKMYTKHGAQAVRGMKTLDFAGTEEVVYERTDWPLPKLQDYFKNDTLALIGYGSQGHGQGLNARDNGLNVIIGVREGGESWKQAQEDGWVPGETLFPIEEAIDRGTIIMNLLSDAAQSSTWPKLKPLITKGKTLYFSHGFSIVYKDDTHVIPPEDIDVILVAPKGSGRTVRTLFKEGRGINSSIAVWQDVTGKAKEKAIALGVAIGSGYMYETTFKKEVYSDLYGERGVVSTFLTHSFKRGRNSDVFFLSVDGCYP